MGRAGIHAALMLPTASADGVSEANRVAMATATEKWAIPSLSSMIDVMEAATPLTNIRYTDNPEGAIYGYEQSMDNAYMTRLEQRTPFKGLYLASA